MEVRLRILMESRIRGNVYVRFGGDDAETYYRNIARRRRLILRVLESLQGDFLQGIEGNTSVAGSREGDGVWRKIRHKRTIAKYADWMK